MCGVADVGGYIIGVRSVGKYLFVLGMRVLGCCGGVFHIYCMFVRMTTVGILCYGLGVHMLVWVIFDDVVCYV